MTGEVCLSKRMVERRHVAVMELSATGKRNIFRHLKRSDESTTAGSVIIGFDEAIGGVSRSGCQ